MTWYSVKISYNCCFYMYMIDGSLFLAQEDNIDFKSDSSTKLACLFPSHTAPLMPLPVLPIHISMMSVYIWNTPPALAMLCIGSLSVLEALPLDYSLSPSPPLQMHSIFKGLFKNCTVCNVDIEGDLMLLSFDVDIDSDYPMSSEFSMVCTCLPCSNAKLIQHHLGGL